MLGALAGPILLLVVAAVLWTAAADIPIVPVPGALGPDFWPRLGLVGLAAAAVVKIVQVWRRGSRPPEASRTAQALHLPRLAGAIALLLLYAALAPLLGFPLATVLFLAAFMRVGGFRRPLAAGAYALAITLVLLYVFVKVVYLPLPRGEWAFHDATLGLYRIMGLI